MYINMYYLIDLVVKLLQKKSGFLLRKNTKK